MKASIADKYTFHFQTYIFLGLLRLRVKEQLLLTFYKNPKIPVLFNILLQEAEVLVLVRLKLHLVYVPLNLDNISKFYHYLDF